MTNDDFNRLKEFIDAEYRKDIEAIERVKRIIPAAPMTPSVVPKRSQKQRGGPVLRQVQEALAVMCGDFSVEGLVTEIERSGAKVCVASVKTVLYRLANRGVVKVVGGINRESRGRKRSLYRVVKG